MRHLVVFLLVLTGLSGCSVPDPETEPMVPLGDFQLSHNVVVAENAKKIGPTRTATPEEWEEILEGAISDRFGGYEGEKLYHLGINLDGYAIALPGVPVVLSPKSVLVISVNVWDDAAQEKINGKPHRLTVFEQIDGGTLLGSGLTRTREEQMANLAAQMAKAVERYLVANGDWFGVDPSQEAIEAAQKDVLELPQPAETVEPAAEAATEG